MSKKINTFSLQWVEPVLPLVKALIDQTEMDSYRKFMIKRLQKRFGEKARFFLISSKTSVGEACERLESCDPETQFHCIELLFHLSIFDSMIAVDRMKELRKYMRGLNPYVVGYFELYYGPLEVGWNIESSFANIDSSQKEECLKILGLGWQAKESDVRYSFVKRVRSLQGIIHFSIDEERRRKSDERLESLVDSYCILFGLKHRKKSVILNTAYEDARTQVINWRRIVIGVIVSIVVLWVLGSLIEETWLNMVSFFSALIFLMAFFNFDMWKLLDDEDLRKEKQLKQDEHLFTPFVNYVCHMNPSAREHQVEILKECYSDRIELCLENNVEYATICGLTSVLRREEYDTRGRLLTLLFRLVVLDDGIKNDEWYFLQSVVANCHMSKQYVDYLNNRYGPLRTESDYQHKESTKSSPSIGKSVYYAMLGVSEGADELTVKKAYRTLVMQHHPDLPKNANRKVECEAMMAKLNEAYEKICG